MHQALRIILAIFAVTLFAFGPTAPVPASAAVDLPSVMAGSVGGVSVVVYATGADDNLVYARFTNATDDTVQVDVPLGMLLEPADLVRTMVTGVGDTILWVEPGGAVLGDSVAYIQAFSAEMKEAAGAAGEPYSFAGLASGDLLLTLENIDNRTAWDDEHAQAAVWHLTDGLDISRDQYAQELVVRGPGGGPTGDTTGGGSTGGDATGGTADGETGGGSNGGDAADGTTGSVGSGGVGRVGSGDRIPGGAAAVAGVAAAVLTAAAAAVTGLLGGAAAAGSTGGGPPARAPPQIGALADAAGGGPGG
ncbi:MAG: hypothetical protein ACYC8U_18875, partial [Thermoleophilia bacterium]